MATRSKEDAAHFEETEIISAVTAKKLKQLSSINCSVTTSYIDGE